MIQGSFNVSKRSSKGVSRQFQKCFKEDSRMLKKVSSVFQENIMKGFKGVSTIFEVLFCNLVVACISSQLPSIRRAC